MTVYIRDGDVYMAFIPLVPVNYGTDYNLRVREHAGYTIVEFFNYQGEEKDFSRNQFALTGNGFICEVASTDEYPSFEAFKDKISQSKVVDEYRAYRHYRRNSQRYTRYYCNDLVLENEYSPIDEGLRFQTYNSEYLKKPILEVDGLDTSKIPFLGNPTHLR